MYFYISMEGEHACYTATEIDFIGTYLATCQLKVQRLFKKKDFWGEAMGADLKL